MRIKLEEGVGRRIVDCLGCRLRRREDKVVEVLLAAFVDGGRVEYDGENDEQRVMGRRLFEAVISQFETRAAP